MKKWFNLILRILPVLVVSRLCFPQARNAEFLLHDRGNLWETMKDDGTIGAPDPTNRFQFYPSMDWPGGPHVLNKDDQRSYMLGAGIWMGGKKSDGSIFFTENGPFSYVDRGTFDKIQEVNNFDGSQGYNPNEAEQKITAHFVTTENISVQRVSRAWSFPGLNNFIIIEYTITNENSYSVSDFYAGFVYLIRPSYQDFVVHNGWGDDFNRTDDYVAYDSTRHLLYSWDDTPNFSLPSDVGNYYAPANELRTPGYAGFSILYADPASDGRPQPSNVFWAQILNNEQYLSVVSSTPDKMYAILTGADKSLQAKPGDHLSPLMLMSDGPYNLKPGASIKIVVAEGVNGIPLSVALQGLAAQKYLPAGLDSLKSTIDLSGKVYGNNYHLSAVPPPSPYLQVIAQPSTKSIALTWPPVEQNYVNPLTGKNNFAGYNIYKSDHSFIGPYTLIRTIKPGRSFDVATYFDDLNNKWVYEDKNISIGAGYFYAVTSFDSSGNESWLTNRNETAVQAARYAAANALNIKVFPNPFKIVSGFPTSGSENNIVWTNLPAQCTIRIYTSSGERVRTLTHDDPNSGEETWDQLTDARQRTAPGIYFWTVESNVGSAKGTLIIIK